MVSNSGHVGQHALESLDADEALAEQQILVATLFLGESVFGIDTAEVQEVVTAADVTPVHHAPGYVLGVMNLRGRIATVIDLGLKLNLDRVAPGPENRILIVEWQGEYIGMLVDRVADVLTIERSALKPPPENVHGLQGRNFKGVCETTAHLVAFLDLEKVLEMEPSDGAQWYQKGRP